MIKGRYAKVVTNDITIDDLKLTLDRKLWAIKLVIKIVIAADSKIWFTDTEEYENKVINIDIIPENPE